MYISETAIEEGVKGVRAKQGVIAIIEVKSGRILCIAKYPGFDPNLYYRYSDSERRNFTVVDSFEPGSTLKVIALAAVLENYPKALRNKYLCKGKIEIADAVINCTRRHGSISLDDIIKYSCNAGIIQAMRSVKKSQFYNLLRRFGFGRRVGIELPGESDGILRPVGSWSGLSKYSISIGQEISVTSLQLVAAFAAIGNKGVYLVPTILESIKKGDGTVIQDFYPRTGGRVLNSMLYAVMCAEAFLLRFVNFPFGVAVLCVAKKK